MVTITSEQSERLCSRAEHLLSLFWQFHGTRTNVRALCDRLQFVDTDSDGSFQVDVQPSTAGDHPLASIHRVNRGVPGRVNAKGAL